MSTRPVTCFLLKFKLKYIMKKVIFMFMLLMATIMNAQTNADNAKLATSMGNYTVGVSTTGLGFSNVNSVTVVNVGLNVGYFVNPGTAVVVGGGYDAFTSSDFNSNAWTYTAGIKQYIGNVVPVQIDWNGATGSGVHPSKSAVGAQVGFGWFPSSNFSIEPAVRYNLSLSDSYENVFSGSLGFHYFF